MKLSFITCLLLVISYVFYPFVTNAHSSLKDTSPTDGQTIDYPLEMVTLEFNSAIEKGSTITVTSNQGKKVDMSSINLEGNVMIAQFAKALPSGDYTAVYTVVGADTHVRKGTFSFTVNATKEEAKSGNTNPAGADGTNNRKGSDPNNDNTATKAELSSTMLTIAGIFILVGIGVIWRLLRKRVSS